MALARCTLKEFRFDRVDKSVTALNTKTLLPTLGTKHVPPGEAIAAALHARNARELSCRTVCDEAVVDAAFASVRVVVPPPAVIVVTRYPGCVAPGGELGM